jgi:hypothetical protein
MNAQHLYCDFETISKARSVTCRELMLWSREKINNPAASCGYQKSALRFVLKASPPNVFIGGPVPNPPVASPVEPPLKACGNDGLRTGNLLNAASCGLLGTDHSGDMSSWRDVPKLRAPDSLTETQKEQILGGNAARLLGLES